MTDFINPTFYMPGEFKLRSGAGGGDPRNGMCFMETASFIAGERVSDRPECACPVLTKFGMTLNDYMPEDERQKLLPFAFAIAGTRSPEHERDRLEMLGRFAISVAEKVAHLNDDPSVLDAINAAKAYWDAPSIAAADAAQATARAAADVAAYAAADAADAAQATARAAAYAAARAAAYAEARAAAYAEAAACAAARAAAYAGHSVWGEALDALARAIAAGPHSLIPEADMKSRIVEGRDVLVAAGSAA